MEKVYEVYGYYSASESGRPGSFLGEYKSRSDADEAVQDFEKVRGRVAWVEEYQQ